MADDGLWLTMDTIRCAQFGKKSLAEQIKMRHDRAVRRYVAWVDANEPILKRTHLAAWNDILWNEGLAQSRELPLPLPSLWRRIFGP